MQVILCNIFKLLFYKKLTPRCDALIKHIPHALKLTIESYVPHSPIYTVTDLYRWRYG